MRKETGPRGQRFVSGRSRKLASALFPTSFRKWVRAQQRRFHLFWPPLGTVNFGDLRRVAPVSRVFALDRGFPIERYYIEQFLTAHFQDVQGRVLEIGDDFYTRKFGGDRVSRSDVLSVLSGEPGVTIVADLTRGDHIPSETFDCILFTQTLQMIYDFRVGLRTLHRILKPGGVLLATTHGISKIGRREGIDHWGEYWRFTTQSAARVFSEYFPASDVNVTAYGNVLTAVATLHGLAAEELDPDEISYRDPDYEVLVAVRAVKSPRS